MKNIPMTLACADCFAELRGFIEFGQRFHGECLFCGGPMRATVPRETVTPKELRLWATESRKRTAVPVRISAAMADWIAEQLDELKAWREDTGQEQEKGPQ